MRSSLQKEDRDKPSDQKLESGHVAETRLRNANTRKTVMEPSYL